MVIDETIDHFVSEKLQWIKMENFLKLLDKIKYIGSIHATKTVPNNV